ncbi:MAG: glycosyltransferase family 2 protein [Candidatus Omnitrophica bacterium]|nr:glycosyltransferase family 2 protein [Candidatus Omnitrophota bacterium]
MINGYKVIVVLPAYRAARTLEKTYEHLPRMGVDDVILVDDASDDGTVEVAKRLGLKVFVHKKNLGYGANQKTCYEEALRLGADIVVMLHPDYQYKPELVPAMVSMIAFGGYDVVLGSRILVKGALKGGMPVYKYIANRFLTFVENILISQKFSEYHTGFRAFRREVLEKLPINENSSGFVFDNEMLVQAVYFKFNIGEISCPARYFREASTIHFFSSVRYGLGVLSTGAKYLLEKMGLAHFRLFDTAGRKLAS